MSKDEEPFTGFNKRELHGTLVGNWVEERQLESDTGVFRYKSWVPASGEYDPATSGPIKREPTATYERVVKHASALPPRQWTTAAQSQFNDPDARPGYFDKRAALGARDRALMAQLEKEAMKAATYPAERPAETVKSSAYGASFVEHDLTGVNVGRRVMYSQDGAKISDADVDVTWRHEAGLATKGELETWAGRTRMGGLSGFESSAAGVGSDRAYTIYEQESRMGRYPSATFKGTTSGGDNPFALSNRWSKQTVDSGKTEESCDYSATMKGIR